MHDVHMQRLWDSQFGVGGGGGSQSAKKKGVQGKVK